MRKYFVLMMLLLCSACTNNLGNFTVLSNKIVDVKNFDLNNARKIPHVKGEDVKHLIIVVPTGTPSLAAALNNVFYTSDSDLLTNASITSSFWMIPYVYGQASFTVEGDAVKTRSN